MFTRRSRYQDHLALGGRCHAGCDTVSFFGGRGKRTACDTLGRWTLGVILFHFLEEEVNELPGTRWDAGRWV